MLFQSAYKQFNSTETVLVKIHKDVILNMDKGKVYVLTKLDLYASFDTFDHTLSLGFVARFRNVFRPICQTDFEE